jgi:microcystin-dependent protein
MAQPFLGEIKMFAGNFQINGWHFCDGSLLSIAQESALFALLGTTYGGDGVNTFGLPDLRGRVPIHQGTGPGLSNYVIGQLSGTETVTLLSTQMPAHNHSVQASTNAGIQPAPSPQGVLAKPVDTLSTPTIYAVPGANPVVASAMPASSISNTGGNLPHDNLMPTVGINYIIALQGVFPSRN